MDKIHAPNDPFFLSRRTILKGLPTSTVLTMLPMNVEAEAVSPDSELLNAWTAYASHRKFCDTLPDDMTDEEWKPFHAEEDRLELLIDTLPAYTSDGVVVKLKRLLLKTNEVRWIEKAVLYQQMLPDALELSGEIDRSALMLFRLIGDVERMTSGTQVISRI